LRKASWEVGEGGVREPGWERGIWAGNGWRRRVNCIYYLGEGTWIFVNGNVNVIYQGLVDLGLSCGKGLWISGEGVGFCWGIEVWKSGRRVVINIKGGEWGLEIG
jgi:hypothetical protein